MPVRPIDRRLFLKGAGVALSLPLLDAMAVRATEATSTVPRRMIAIETNQGILPNFFFPKGSGKNYELSPYLAEIKEFREQVTVLSGVSHPEVDGGHRAECCFLTAAPPSRPRGFSQHHICRSVCGRANRPSDPIPLAEPQLRHAGKYLVHRFWGANPWR